MEQALATVLPVGRRRDLVALVFFSLACSLLCVLFCERALAQFHVVEFRRTFSAKDCSTGEMLVDGKIAAFFYSSSSLFNTKVESEPVVGDSAVTEVFQEAAPGLSKRTLGAKILSGGAEKVRLLALDETSYSQYQRPRKKAFRLPEDIILIGTKILNRECSISSTGEDEYFDHNWYYAWPSEIIAQQIFDGRITRKDYTPLVKSDAIFMFSDFSTVRSYNFQLGTATVRSPREAVEIAADDPCLTKGEHMLNTFIKAGGAVTYTRKDDIWYCTGGDLVGVKGKTFIEFAFTLRYWEFVSDEICGNVLGIPVNRLYLVGRNGGQATWVSSRCYGTDDWTNLTDSASVTMD